MSLASWWEAKNERYHTRTKFWRTLPRVSIGLMLLFVFLLFAGVGLIGTVTDYRVLPAWAFALMKLCWGTRTRT